MARISGRSSKPRRPGMCSSTSTTLYGWRRPEAKLVAVTKRAMAPLVADNPHLAEVVALEPDEPIRHLARRLSALAPTHGLDLHGSVRSAALRLLVRCRWSGYR